MSRFLFFLSVLCVFTILVLNKDHYWRSYTDTPQESLASIHAHGFAIANLAGLGRNPVLARDIDVKGGTIVERNHWPNGFFLTLTAFITVFGNTEIVGRSLALLYTILGLYFLAFAFRNKAGISYMVVPVVLSTPIGRDCLSFVFVDAALLFWIGFSAMAISLTNEKLRLSTILFRVSAIISPFFVHLVAPYLFWGAFARFFLGHKDKKILLVDVCCVVGAVTSVLVLLSWTSNGMVAGAKELFAHYLHRAQIHNRYEEEVTLYHWARQLRTHYFTNIGWFTLLLPLAYYNMIKHRIIQVYLLIAVVTYSIILVNYVAVHVFANLPLITISIFTIVSGIEHTYIFDTIGARSCIAITMLSLLFMMPEFSYYKPDHVVCLQMHSLRQMKYSLLESEFNAFHLQPDTDYRIPQMFCGPRVVQSLLNSETKRVGVLDLGKMLVVGN